MERCWRTLFIIFIACGLALPNAYAASKTKHKAKSSSHKTTKKSRIRTKPHSDDYMDGVASCYAKKFVGRRTTSGDIFVMDRFTGAHTTLPMRTKLKVTNVKNGKFVYIEVNDRMARVSGHVIDLPTRSAEALGMRCPTLAIAHLDILDNDTYNSLLKGQLGQSAILSNPLFTSEQQLEIANQLAEKMADKESADNSGESSVTQQIPSENNEESK